MWPLRFGRQAVAHVLNVVLEFLVGVEAELGRDLLVVGLAHCDFLLFADQRQLPLSGCRVERARGQHQG